MIKKVMGLLMGIVAISFSLACNESQTTLGETTITEIPTTQSPSSQTSQITDLGLSQENVNAYKEQVINLEFSYFLRSAESNRIEAMIEAFEEMYPNVNVVSTRHPDDENVITNFGNLIMAGQAPDIILTHQKYLSIFSNNFSPLKQYMESNAVLDGKKVGIDNSYIEEGMISSYLEYDQIISFPFTRMSQVIFANRTILADNASLLRDEGIKINDQGFIDKTSGLTENNLLAIKSVITDKSILTIEKPYLVFKTLLGQNNINLYDDNHLSVNQDSVNTLMSNLRNLSESSVIDISSHFDDNVYTNHLFASEDTVFALSSPDAMKYMVDYNEFDVDVLPFIRLGYSGSVFYGSDFGININSSDAEKFYSWMFIRFMTDLDNGYLSFCLDFGYSPIQSSSLYVNEDLYSDFLEIGQNYIANNGEPGWTSLDDRWEKLYYSVVQSVYIVHRENVYNQVYTESVSPGQVKNQQNLYNDYLYSVFYSTDSIETLTAGLNEDLSD